MDAQRKIDQLVELKQGDKDISITRYADDNTWTIRMGNPSRVVDLGETRGQIEVRNAPNLEAALGQLEFMIPQWNETKVEMVSDFKRT